MAEMTLLAARRATAKKEAKMFNAGNQLVPSHQMTAERAAIRLGRG